MWNEMAPLITFVLSFAVAWAAFLGKLFAVALRRDDKQKILRDYLGEKYPTIKLTIVAAVVTFIFSVYSPFNHFIYRGSKLILWSFLYLVPYYAWLWEPPERVKTDEELKMEYGERLCPFCNKPLDIENDVYVCKSEGCEYKYYLEDLPEYQHSKNDKLKWWELLVLQQILLWVSGFVTSYLFQCLI